MTFTRFVIPTVFAAALALSATPAAAQHRGGARVSRGTVSRGAVSRGTISRGRAVVRSAPVFRGTFDRAIVRRGPLPRGGFFFRPSYATSFYRPFYTFRPRISLGIGLWAGYPLSFSAFYGYGYPYYYGYYPPAPYYGYYGYSYPSYPPYYYDDPSNSPSSAYPPPPPDSSGYGTYPPQPQSGGSVAVQPGAEQPGAEQEASGGVTFEITPSTASVFVDGTYMGRGSDFGANMQPLGLSVGRHHIEIRAEGYRTMSFDADVTAGQVTPYRAELQRQ